MKKTFVGGHVQCDLEVWADNGMDVDLRITGPGTKASAVFTARTADRADIANLIAPDGSEVVENCEHKAEAENWSEPLQDMDLTRLYSIGKSLGYTLLATPSGDSRCWYAADYDLGSRRLAEHATLWKDSLSAVRSALWQVASRKQVVCTCKTGSVSRECIWLGEGPMPEETP